MPSKAPLDRIDNEILAHLQKDARITNKDLAAQVGIAPSTCLGRVQRLVEQGVLRGFHASVDPRALGLDLQAVVFVQLEHHGGAATQRFEAELLELDEVVHLYHVGGAQDLLVHVAVQDTEHLRAVVMDHIAAGTHVRHVETNVVFEHHARPYPLAGEAATRRAH